MVWLSGKEVKMPFNSGPSSVSGYGDLFPFCNFALLAPHSRCGRSMGYWLNLKLRRGQGSLPCSGSDVFRKL